VRIYVDGKILQEGVFRVVCPTLGCQVELAHEEVRQIASQRAFARYSLVRLSMAEDVDATSF